MNEKPRIETIVQTGHSMEVLALHLDPKGELLATVCRDFTVKLWETNRGKLLRSFPGHSGWVVGVCISNDRSMIATASWDATVRLWNLLNGDPIGIFQMPSGAESVCFSPDSGRLYGGASDGSVQLLWQARGNKRKKNMPDFLAAHTDKVKAMQACEHEGQQWLATAGRDGFARIWNADTGDLLYEFTAHPDEVGKEHQLEFWEAHPLSVRSVCFSPDKKHLITGSNDGTARVWDLQGGNAQTESARTFEHPGKVRSVEVSPDGQFLYAACDASVYVWDLNNPDSTQPHSLFDGGHISDITCVKASSSGAFLFTSGKDSGVQCWSTQTRLVMRSFYGPAIHANAAAIHNNGRHLAVGHYGNIVNVWDLQAGKLASTLLHSSEPSEFGTGSGVMSVQYSADGQYLLSGSGDGSAALWNAADGARMQTFQTGNYVLSARIGSDNKHILAGGGSSEALLWELADPGKNPVVYNSETEWIGGVDLNAGKGWLAIACDHPGSSEVNRVALWNLNTGEQHNLESHGWRIRSLRISADGNYLVSGSCDLTAHVWDLNRLDQAPVSLEGHTGWVISVDISADGSRVVTGSDDGTARIWDRASGATLFELKGHSAGVLVSMSPDGKQVITTGQDATTRIWRVDTGEHVATMIAIEREDQAETEGGLLPKDWVVLGPNALFDASPAAMKKMHYVRGFEVIELDQLKSRYWQPGLLPILTGFVNEPLPDVSPIDNLKLFPEIISMELKGKVLHVKLQDRDGIGRVSLRVNNKEMERDINPGRKKQFSYKLDQCERFWINGDNTVSIRCWNTDDWLSGPFSECVYTYNGAPGGGYGRFDDDAVRLYALFIGTSKYKRLQSLQFPDRDAMALSEAMHLVGDPLFQNNVDIRLLTTDAASEKDQSTKANIRQAFEDIAQKARPQDVVLFYFSGHGTNFHDGNKALYYYLTRDTEYDKLSNADYRNETVVSSEEISQWLLNITAQKMVLILDTCYAGKILDSLQSKDAVDATREREFDRMKDRAGTFVLAGCASDKVSYEGNVYEQGFLTYALLMGMRGAALQKAANQQEYSVDVLTLFSWSKEEVTRMSQEFGVVQTPTLRPPLQVESFAIGIATDDTRDDIRVALPRPVFSRSVFMDAEEFLDPLDLSDTLDQYLAGNIGIGKRPKAVLLDVAGFPGAHQVRGVYAKKDDVFEVRVKVYKDERVEHNFVKKMLGTFTVRGEGMSDLIPRIAREVEHLAFPIEDNLRMDEVPDSKKELIARGLNDDLATITGEKGIFGYDENFIEPGNPKYRVPLPKLHTSHKKELAELDKKETVLKYQYYSTQHNKTRKLPFYAACNLHGGAFMTAGREGVFVYDDRLPRDFQCGDEVYKFVYKGSAYTSFCHRGHMAKREDPQWAVLPKNARPPANESAAAREAREKQEQETLLEIARRGARLTFFFTNAIPQHGHLNGVVWRGLEDYIMSVATNNKTATGDDLYRINIMTGPVFRSDDPVFPYEKDGKQLELKVPALFWKVVYYKKQDGTLCRIGFMMGQRELLKAEFERLDGIKARDAQGQAAEPPPFEGYKDKEVFQVKVSLIEEMTKLKFHPAHDPFSGKVTSREIIEKVQVVKKDALGGPLDGPGYILDGLEC